MNRTKRAGRWASLPRPWRPRPNDAPANPTHKSCARYATFHPTRLVSSDHARRTILVLRISLILLAVSVARAQEWPQFARDAANSSRAPRAARTLPEPRWTATPLPDEEFVTDSSPVVAGGLVIVNARRYENAAHVGNRLIAYDIYDGRRVWATHLEPDLWDSWSSPAVDLSNRTAIIGVGFNVYACDLETGQILWQTPLNRRIVDASPTVTHDLNVAGVPANRAFITDCNYVGQAKLYALNLDPFHQTHNPFQPGQIAWSANLPGASGNTPAYQAGVVYAVSLDGLLVARDAADGSFMWQTQVDLSPYPQYTGFYGGLALTDEALYCAAYAFYGTGDNSGLFKFNLATGELVWQIACERTNSIPVVAENGRIFLAAGLAGYGSAVKLQAFQDHGTSAAKLWDTYFDTSGGLIIGGWTAQPAYSRGYLYAGKPVHAGGDAGQTYLELYILDANRNPADPDFILAQYPGAGGSTAIADGSLYSLGVGGLLVFDPSPACLADIDADSVVALGDLAELLGRYGSNRWNARFDSAADLNRDGVIDLSDLAALLGAYGATCD